MKNISICLLVLGLMAGNAMAMGAAAKAEHPTNASGSPLVSETTHVVVVKRYADGTKERVKSPKRVVVSSKHVPVFNEHALKKLPRHLHKHHKKHIKGKSHEEVASLYVGGLGVLFGDPMTQRVEGRLVGDAIKVVGGVVTGNVKRVIGGGVGFVSHLASGIQQLSARRGYVDPLAGVRGYYR